MRGPCTSVFESILMGRHISTGRTVLILSWLALAGCSSSLPPRPLLVDLQKRDRFHVVDILIYKDKPDVTHLGMLPGNGTAAFWRLGDARDEIDEPAFRSEIEKWKDFPGLFYLELEQWPVCNAPDSTTERSMQKMSRAVAIVREVAPRMTFGIYGTPPAFGYWPIVGRDSTELRKWRECNVRLRQLASKVDVIMPSLYTFYDDEAGWEAFAKGQLMAAKAYGKPVYPFLWPEYHESSPTLAGKLVPGPAWRRELEFVRRNADGVVLWNGWRRPWDERADWWLETVKFIRSLPSL